MHDIFLFPTINFSCTLTSLSSYNILGPRSPHRKHAHACPSRLSQRLVCNYRTFDTCCVYGASIWGDFVDVCAWLRVCMWSMDKIRTRRVVLASQIAIANSVDVKVCKASRAEWFGMKATSDAVLLCIHIGRKKKGYESMRMNELGFFDWNLNHPNTDCICRRMGK